MTRKKYNPNKALQRVTRAQMRNVFVVWHSFTDSKVDLYHRSGKRIIPSAQLHHAMTQARYEWSVIMAVFGVAPDGKLYMKSSLLESQEPYTHAELCDELNRQHKAMIRQANQSQFCGVGWIASISGQDLSEEEAYNLFELSGVGLEQNGIGNLAQQG